MKTSFNKIVGVMVAILLCTTIISGCGSDNNGNSSSAEVVIEANTIGTTYMAAFNASSATDVNAIVDDLLANVSTELDLVKMDVVPGYLNGFTEEINGFEQGVMFSPMIGSVPFVGYVFKSSDPEKLETALKNSADLRWNVCTEADEMVSLVKGNYVFFIMCLNEEQ